ncbi:putative leader peptide [Kitasatospora sp. NBC_01287]
MEQRPSLTRRRHVDLQRVSGSLCCPGIRG